MTHWREGRFPRASRCPSEGNRGDGEGSGGAGDVGGQVGGGPAEDWGDRGKAEKRGFFH